MAISTRDLKLLPDIDVLRRAIQSIAMLDAILSPEWEFRYYSFNSKWAPGEQMGSMHNGSGDEVFALFNSSGCFIKGFAHEYPMSPYARDDEALWPGLIDSVPREFAACLKEPAFSPKDTTFCIWRRIADKSWQRGEIEFPKGADPDGSEYLLQGFDARPATYQEFAQEYYERKVDLGCVKNVFEHKPLTGALIAKLNPDLTLDDLAHEIDEIAYAR